MSSTRHGSDHRRSHPPLWLVEGLDVVEQRRPVLVAVVLVVVVVGALLTLVAPGLVPPSPLVGAAVGFAALLLGLAVAIALDATDLRLRGPRHVGAAGGELVAVLPTVAEPDDAATLASAVLEAREPGTPLLLGLAASGRDVRPTTTWTDALATALEAEGVSVLRIDLASGHSTPPGLIEVVRDGVRLTSAVTFGPEPRLARLGAGGDHRAALDALAALPSRLPRDLDVLLVALPMAASRQVVAAVRSLDHVLIVAQRDRTSRVELIAGLDALEAAGTRAQVALLDDRTAARLVRHDRGSDPEPDTTPTTDATDAPEAHGAGPGRPAGTDDAPGADPTVPASARRDVEVVHGATEAAAIALVAAPQLQGIGITGGTSAGDDAPVDGALPVGGTAAADEHVPAAPATVELGAPTEVAPTEVAPTEVDAAASEVAPTEVDAAASEADGDADRTDRVPRVDAGGTAISEADAEHDEMMRTTAQLAVLLGDLDVPLDDLEAPHNDVLRTDGATTSEDAERRSPPPSR